MKRSLLALGLVLQSWALWSQITTTVTAPAGPTNSSTLAFTVAFSQPVENFSSPGSDLIIGGTATGTLVGGITGGGANYTVNITGMTGSGTVTLQIPGGAADETGSGTTPNTISNVGTVTFDNVSPDVTINQKTPSQADPTNISPVLFTVVFSEPIQPATFTSGDVSTAFGTVASITPVNSTTFEVSINGSGEGVIQPTIAAGTVQDLAGNTNLVSTSTDNSVTFDNLGPTVTVEQKSADPTSSVPVTFEVTFSQPIALASFINSDITLGGTATGGSVSGITEIAPLNGTKFDVTVTATGGGTITASLSAGVVTDPIGNGNAASTSADNSITYQTIPVVDSPTVTGIGSGDADLGGNVVSNGGAVLTARGTVWKTSAGVASTDNPQTEGGTSTGTFSHNRASLPSGTQIFFRAYATNSVGTGLSSEASFFTFSAVPGSEDPNFTATVNSATQITLNFSAYTSITNADGYVILRRAGSNPVITEVQDGVAPTLINPGSSTRVAIITTTTPTFIDNSGLTAGTTYHYAIVPFNWNGINPETYQYLQGGGPSFGANYLTSAVTFANNSVITLNSGTTADIAYASNLTASGLNNGNSVSLGTFRIDDGGASNDLDNAGTTLTSITFSIANHANVRTIALFDGGSNLAEVAVTTNSVTFNSLSITAGDDDTNDFNIRATFNDVVTDNQPITLTITNAVASASGSGFRNSTASDPPSTPTATTGSGTNRIEVTATKAVFVPTSITTDVNVGFSIQARALDALDNLDLDETSNVTLALTGGPGSLATTLPDLATKPFVAGVVSWTNLQINLAGSAYTLTGQVSFTDATASITVNSLGVNITGPSNQNFCLGGNFQPLTNIVITEVDPSDFTVGSNVTYSIILPDGFEFNTAVTPTLSETGDNITALTSTSPPYQASNIYRFRYTSSNVVAPLDQITIAGLQVRYTGTSAVSNQPILRIGGSAIVAGSPVDTPASHGTISASMSGTSVSFTVAEIPGNPVVNASETRFSKNGNPVRLIGNPSGGVFSGNGVVNTGGANGFTFNPSLLVANTYPITYTYTEPSGQNCVITSTTNFEVFESIITNLALQYCNNADASAPLSVDANRITARFGLGTNVLNDFVYWTGSGWAQIPASGDPATTTTFDPKSALFINSINSFGGVYVGYRVRTVPPGNVVNTLDIEWQFVRVNRAPTVSFNLPSSTCSFDASIILVDGTSSRVTPRPQNTTTDRFTGGAGALQNPSANEWVFVPANVPIGSLGSPIDIIYTFQDPATNCSNSITRAITVFPRPTNIPSSDILVGGTPSLSSVACQGSTPTGFTGASVSGVSYRWFADAGLTDLRSTTNTFNPPVNTSTPGNTQFFATRVINGCQSLATTIVTIINAPAVVDAGSPQLICSGGALTLSGLGASITNPAGSGTWSSLSASPGVFRDISSNVNTAFSTAASYTPSATEVTNGSFILRLTTNDPDAGGPCTALFDQVTITINSVAQANVGADRTVCAGQPITLSGLISGAATTATWSDNGRGGTFSPSNTSLTAVYNPVSADLTNGASGINISLSTDDPPGPCPAATDNLVLSINQAPTVDAGSDRFVCQGNIFNLSSALPSVGGSATSAVWTALPGGVLGTFAGNTGVANSFQLATFTPDPTRFGATSLRLTTDDPDGAGPCVAATDVITLNTNQAPLVGAGPDVTFCADQTITLNGSRSGSTSAVTWSRVTGSGGSFGNLNAQATNFIPTAPELVNGAIITFRITSDDPDGTDPITGPCVPAQDETTITINQRPEINAGADQTLCADEPVNLSATLIGSASSGNWSGGGGSFTTGASLASQYNLSTSEQAGGLTVALTFTTNDSDGAGPCVPGTDQVSITVKPVPGSPTITDPGEYCVGDVILPLEATGAPTSTIRWYSDAAITNLAGTGNSFASGVPNTVASQTRFYATQTVDGCESNVPTAFEDIIINPLPVTQFQEADFCLDPAGNGVDFESTSTITSGSVVKWGWSFGDLDRLDRDAGNIPAGTHQGATTGTFERPSHRYRNFGDFSVVLTTESDKGCISSRSKTITIEPIPEPNFQFRDVCSTDNTRFEYIGTFQSFIGGTGGYAWEFDDDEATSAAAQPAHRFTGPGNYDVELTVTTNLGCKGTKTKTVSILPLVTVSNGNPYTQSFEANNHGWFSEGFTPRNPAVADQYFNSWQVAVANFPDISEASDGTRIWITRDNTLGTYRNDERSVLNSPCFVINNTRPVLSFDLWNSTDERRDGAYLEVSTNNGVSWAPLGGQNQGLNWYNTDAITGLAQVVGKEQSGPIGQSVGQIGWSGQTNEWNNARIALDAFGGNRIRLRYVFGSNSDQPSQGIYDGFALDNFAIDSRNRLVLVENFTNATTSGAAANNANFRTFQQNAASEIVKVQYHTSFPGADPINAQNNVDLNARVAFYGVTSAPRGYVDGVSNAPFTFATPAWANNAYNNQSLSTAPIAISVTPSRDNNNLNVNVSVTAIKANIPGAKYILFVGVLEGNVGSEQFVLRKFLPSAAGTPLPALTIGGAPFTSNLSWPIDSRNFAATTPGALNLSVIAFVQAAQPDPATQVREVLQAALNTTPVPAFDSFTTGLEALTSDAIATYPNPAKDLVTVQLPFEAREPVAVALVDQFGKRVQTGEIGRGRQQTSMPVSGLAAGVYILQIGNSEHSVRKKIVIAQ